MQIGGCLAISKALASNTFNNGEEDKAYNIFNMQNNPTTNKSLEELKRMLHILETSTCTFTISDVLKRYKTLSSTLETTLGIKKEMITIEEGILAKNKEIVTKWEKLATVWKEEEAEEKEKTIELKNLIAI